MPQRIAIETWDPEYGVAATALADSGTAAEIDADIEVPAAGWQPISPPPVPVPARLVFVDGVRRIDAHAWLDDGSGPRQGILASYAAGTTVVEQRARIGPVEVRRQLFAPGDPQPFATRVGDYLPCGVVTEGAEALSASLQDELGKLEVEVATRVGEADLVVVDGPLYGHRHSSYTVGYIKTHRVQYLAALPAASRAIAALNAGERTPVFRFRTSWTRHSWYLRLPGPRVHAWSGVVRVESAPDATLAETQRLADCTSALLPRFASTPHKDPRAPQNLFPIAGLERQLRHRLGDPAFVHRALREAAHGGRRAAKPATADEATDA